LMRRPEESWGNAMRAQGATEYLVILAVVLMIALVAIGLLGYFPGMAQDAQATELKTYWSTTPISIVESGAKHLFYDSNSSANDIYLRIRNNGNYPITITKVLGNGEEISQVNVGSMQSISDYYSLNPGEEKYFGWSPPFNVPQMRLIWIDAYIAPSSSSANRLFAATSVCDPTNHSANPGSLIIKDFGFEYVAHVDSNTVTKRMVGTKPLIIRCDAY